MVQSNKCISSNGIMSHALMPRCPPHLVVVINECTDLNHINCVEEFYFYFVIKFLSNIQSGLVYVILVVHLNIINFIPNSLN